MITVQQARKNCSKSVENRESGCLFFWTGRTQKSCLRILKICFHTGILFFQHRDIFEVLKFKGRVIMRIIMRIIKLIIKKHREKQRTANWKFQHWKGCISLLSSAPSTPHIHPPLDCKGVILNYFGRSKTFSFCTVTYCSLARSLIWGTSLQYSSQYCHSIFSCWWWSGRSHLTHKASSLSPSLKYMRSYCTTHSVNIGVRLKNRSGR